VDAEDRMEVSTLARCEALTGPDHPCWWPASEYDGLTLCRAHQRMLRDGRAIRLTDNRQARIARNVLGTDPQMVIARVGFDDETRQETAA
jgi:hypothetical protein